MAGAFSSLRDRCYLQEFVEAKTESRVARIPDGNVYAISTFPWVNFFSFISWHVASDLVSFGHTCHSVRVGRRSWFGLRYLLWSPRTRLKMCRVPVKNPKIWAPISSAGREGVPCAEALSSLQQPGVRVLAWGPLLRITPLPFSPHFLSSLCSCPINKTAQKPTQRSPWSPGNYSVVPHLQACETRLQLSHL